jgi:GNAT superfamily N-acetyltransferase
VKRSKASNPPPAGPFGFDVRPAWRRDDPQIEADAIEFWTRHGLLPKDVAPEKRAKELLAAAYKDGRLVAVSTAHIEDIGLLGARMAVIRGATDPEYRRSHAQLSLAIPSREALRDWALANPREKLAGGIVFVDKEEWGGFSRLPVWPESELALAGHDQHGSQIRLRWFEHFYYGDEPAPPPFPSLTGALPPGIEIRVSWRAGNSEIEQDAVAFWQRLGNLPAGAQPEARAKEIVVAAYHDGRMIGVTTAEVGILPRLRTRLAMLRGSVDPDYRRTHVGLAMFPRALATLESWAAANPDERVTGVGGILEAPELAAFQRRPHWPESRFHLIGFTPDGRQIRVRWFRDVLLD